MVKICSAREWGSQSLIGHIMACVLVLLSFNAQAGEVKVTVEEDVVSINDSFTVLFQVGQGVHGRPDLSPLNKDFRIISTQQRSNVTIINGKPTSQSEWLLELMANETGEKIIPSIMFGRTPTKEVTINIVDGQAPTAQADDNDIFLEVDVSTERSWVQAQIIYTIRLFRAVTTVNSRLSEPNSSHGQMFMEKLEDRQFETFRNNKRYAVLQRRYALFPQSSGEVTIAPISFQGQIRQRTQSVFDPFGRGSKAVQRFSPEIKLDIQPVPDDFTGGLWLPAKNIQLHEKWLKDDLTLTAGEPATRTIVLRADGLMSAQLPEIDSSEITGFRLYPEQPELTNQHSQEGILGVREEKSAVIANEAGEYTLPAVNIPWFNTDTGKMEIATLPERVIKVIADQSSGTNEDETDNGASGEAAQTSDQTIQQVAQNNQASYWPWLAGFFAMGWLVTALLWWRNQSKNDQTINNETSASLSKKKALSNLRSVIVQQGVRQDNQAVKTAVLDWGKSAWPDSPPGSLGNIMERVDGDLEKEISLLNVALYQSTDAGWGVEDAQRLLHAIETYQLKTTDHDQLAEKAKTNLQPLHKV